MTKELIITYDKTFRMDDVAFGYLGECWAVLELAKRDVRVIRIPEGLFGFDFYTSTGARIEVKTAHLSIRKDGRDEWRFSNWKTAQTFIGHSQVARKIERLNRLCDFFILVCVKAEGNPKFFVVPKSEVMQVMNISVYSTGSSKWLKWEDRWNLITDFSAVH
jgi:hypothetical protein